MESKSEPTQSEVDSIASFNEAIDELENEPFFSADEPRGMSKDRSGVIYKLGDRCHFRSALITFRRIWMNNDAENFDVVCKIIGKHEEHSRPLLGDIRKQVKFIVNANALSEKDLPIVKNEELVNLWLNAVFAHSGLRGKNEILRHLFDALVADYGIGRVEYAFRRSVFQLSLLYFQLAKFLARPLATQWADINLKPSFAAGSPFGKNRRERTPDGSIVIRQSSSEFFSEESFEQRFYRILGRSRFSNLKFLFNNLELSERKLAQLVLRHSNIEYFLKDADFELRIETEIPIPTQVEGAHFFCGLETNNFKRQSSLFGTGFEIITDSMGVDILNSMMSSLRKMLFE